MATSNIDWEFRIEEYQDDAGSTRWRIVVYFKDARVGETTFSSKENADAFVNGIIEKTLIAQLK